jgi:hypothetical protein
MADAATGDDLPELVHPVYLDVPMAISFLAALEGGVAFEDQSTTKTGTTRAKEREGKGGVRLPGFAALMGLGFDMSGRLATRAGEETSEEVVAVRRHTEASLFTLLRQQLRESGAVSPVRSATDLEHIEAGDLVECSGEALGNPLEQLLDLLAQVMPYTGVTPEDLEATVAGETEKKKKNPRKSGNPAVAARAGEIEAEQEAALDEVREQARGMLLALRMRNDLAAARVKDYLLRAQDGLSVVLTLSTEFFDQQTSEYLLAGEFKALGKVTRVLGPDDVINLTRRTAFGIAGPETYRDVVMGAAADIEGVSVADPLVEAPALQMLPLAVFV